jgi:DNA-binding winged helix-turn-helix (wHTH) protein
MQRTVTNGRETAYLTPIEVKIVRTLADNLGRVVERNAMKQLCWGDAEITDNALNRKIYEVRRTLRRLSESVNIRTIYGLGFELRVRG